MQQEVRELRQDFQVMQQEVRGLRQDFQVMQQEVRGLQTENRGILDVLQHRQGND